VETRWPPVSDGMLSTCVTEVNGELIFMFFCATSSVDLNACVNDLDRIHLFEHGNKI
jgi:hypothetical protein